MQLKCVCKSWKTLISNDSTLVKLHLKRSTAKRVALFSFRYKGSRKYKGSQIWLYLCNPATKTLSNKIVFISKPHTYDRSFGSRFRHGWKFPFGYDNSTDTYKIVAFCLWTKEVRVFNFGDNVWRNIQSFPIVPVDCGGFPSDEQGPHPGINNGGCFVIISLDLSTETYLQLLPPWDFDKLPCLQPTLVVLMDCLCLSFSHGFDGTDFIIWQMKEFGVQESWIQFLKISYQNLRSLMSYDYQSLLFPVCLSENGDNTLILVWGTSNEEAILCSLRDNSVKKSRKFTNEIRWYLAKDYVESLVSIDRK
ncbi:F-box family protein [Trifolium medium]|uniref:F-box family protein n=1 Tax=Trifolium medium TaxID=97028 RepID=A0A392MEZ9_9FABA|nr:F-box family protein [Trifolium medium]